MARNRRRPTEAAAAEPAAAPETQEQPLGGPEIAAKLQELLGALGPLTSNVVNLEPFLQGDLRYEGCVDVHGEEHAFVIPKDPPFPVVLTFLTAHDQMLAAARDLEEAKRHLDGAQAVADRSSSRSGARLTASRAVKLVEQRIRAYAKAWDGAVGAFAELLRIRQPEVTAAALQDPQAGFGQSFLTSWMEAFILRFNNRRILSVIDSLMSPPKEGPVPPPEAKTRRARSTSRT